MARSHTDFRGFRRTAAVLGLAAALVGVSTALTAARQGPAPPSGRADGLEAAARANNLGVARLEQYDYEAAVGEFRRALEAAPDFTLARVNLAIGLFYHGSHAEAAAEARRVIERVPASPQAHYVLGLVGKAANEPDAAAAAYEQVLAVDPHDLGARIGLGQIRLQQRRFEDAAALFASASADEPFNVTAAYNLGVALTRAGRAEEGKAAMEKFQVLRESGYGTNFSNNYLEQGRYAEALVSTGLEPGLVQRGTPAVRFEPVAVDGAPALATVTASGAATPSVTLADLDRDGDLDLVVTGPHGALLRNDAGRLVAWTDSGIPAATLAGASGAVAADYDNDTAPDLVVLGPQGVTLWRQDRPGHFEDRTAAAGLAAVRVSPRTAAMADVDHDGDADLVLGGAGGLALYRNGGMGAFTDVTADARLTLDTPVGAIVPTDIDNRRDLDLLVLTDGSGLRLFRNLREGTFGEQAARFGLDGHAAARTVTVADINKDDGPDVVVGGAVIEAAMSGTAGPLSRRSTAPVPGTTALQALDYDNDGLLDLVALSPAGLHVLRFVGDAWTDVTAAAAPAASWAARRASAGAPVAFAAGDVDGDGDTDLVMAHGSGAVTLAANSDSQGQRSVPVQLTGRVSNRSAVGAKVELRAGSLRQRLETVAATPAPVPADTRFGLGTRTSADVLRVLWPSGVVQAEVLEAASAQGREPLAVTELDRKPSSCPFLYTWNGREFTFVTDFLGGGELGYWVAPGVRSAPDPDEYVRIPTGALAARDGAYELRVTNELEETLYIDRLQLLRVQHPPGTDVFPNEGLRGGPAAPFSLYVTPGTRPVRRALDHAGRDVTERLAQVDRRYVDDLPLLPLRGYAAPHALTLDLGEARPADGRLLLLLTGWTDYAFSSDNVAAAQAGLALQAPSLQVRDVGGAWRTAIDQIGLPVGRPQTVVVDLTGALPSGSREVRILTSMRVYWDEARVATGAALVTPDPHAARVEIRVPGGHVTVSRIEPARADLAWRGFSAEVRPGGTEPPGYDYAQVSPVSPWKEMPGRYTREGDVRDLLGAVDDMFVVSRPGDEIAVIFPATASQGVAPTDAPQSERAAPAAPHAETFLLFAHGYSKEMDINSASPDQALPLPFRTMSQYPYRAPERFPATDAHRRYVEQYNTRVVGRSLPPIEVSAGQAAPAPRGPARAATPAGAPEDPAAPGPAGR
jgi:Tfp pilus assembly protein PilF